MNWYKKPFQNAEKVYHIETYSLQTEQKLTLNRLIKANTLTRTENKAKIVEMKLKMKILKEIRRKAIKNQLSKEKSPNSKSNFTFANAPSKSPIVQTSGPTQIIDSDSYQNDNYSPMEGMTTQERRERVKWLWINVFLKAKGSAVILKTFEDLNHRILQFGTKRGIIKRKEDEFKPLWFIISPESWFKKIWNIVVMVLLVYTASYAPYRMAFIDNVTLEAFIFETFIDALFFIDLWVNLVSAYERPDGTFEYRWKEITLNYLKGWLILDVVASFPFQVLDLIGADTGTGQYNTLRKLARLPRLARLFRVLRIVKLVKIIKNNKTVQNALEKLSMNPGIMRLITTLIIVSVWVHVFSCLWFLQSKMQDHNPDTWVARYEAQDLEVKLQYLTAVYWSCQVLTTVGYGDFGVGNATEIYMNIFWMIFGVAFYSFVIGNIQSIITKIDEDTEDLVNKLKALEKFKKQNNLKESVYRRIKKFLEQNYNNLKWTMDFDELLPATLNDEILMHIYGDTVNNIIFFKEMTKKNFVWTILPILQTIKIEYGGTLYVERDLAKEMYFIKSGSIKLYYKGMKILTVYEGDYFGEVEMFFNINRELKAKAREDCVLLVVQKKQLELVLTEFPDVRNDMLNLAKEKREKYYEIIIQRNLPMPKSTLDVYGVPNLDSESPRKDQDTLQVQNENSKNKELSTFRQNKNSKSSKKSKSRSTFVEPPPPASPKKIEIIVPDPLDLHLSQINPLESQDLHHISSAMDSKLKIQQTFSSSLPQNPQISESEVIKLLQNYSEDMQLIQLGKLINT
jgi:hypothetical protein